MLGLSLPVFTAVHTIISLIGIAAGAVALILLLQGKVARAWNNVFWWTTVATSVTGFMFPFKAFGAPHAVGVISLVVLALAGVALYRYRLVGRAFAVYVVAATTALYLNAFVGVVQAFQKLAPFHSLAPTQTEPPFLIAQLATLTAFIALGFFILRNSRRGSVSSELRLS